ncbi:MAG TPA: YbaB/EbfC family nucleoid-associated protein [Candidatus Binataceae bacterium]|nr:YbaB/EbfC family nucleoid-associated protein [Candidatus Binataceae bacterium]
MSEPPEFDFSALMKQAQAMQEKLQRMHEEAAQKTVEANSGGGMVRAILDGSMRVRRIEIDQGLLAANDKSMIEDLIVVAVNDGLRRVQEMVAEDMRKLSPLGGLNIPGIFGGNQ